MLKRSPENEALLAVGAATMAPAWLVSLAVHLLVAILGSLVVRGLSSAGPSVEPARAGEIILARREANRTEYFADDAGGLPHEVLKPVDAAGGTLTASGPGATDDPPLVAGVALPRISGNLPVGEGVVAAPQLRGPRARPRLPGNPLDEAAILAEDALIPREVVPSGPTAQLSLFGSANAEGRSFVFVIDRSSSMGGAGLGAIQAAAQELAGRIDQLSGEQTFQVVAYNEAAAYLTVRELVPATIENKRMLVKFVENIAAFGQTEHTRGILSALYMKPEVIFLLTDGGDPVLDAGQLRLIREQSAGRTSIHCIQFGRGPQTESARPLVRLAAENRGSFVYIDMNAR